ncbi:hypothetical protein D3C76_1148420 [compost metagenome]
MLSQWTEHWMLIFGPLLLLVVLFGKKGVYGLLLSLLQRKPKVVAVKPNAAVEVRP